jgi:hypothetical protein
MAAAPFFFQILLASRKGAPSDTANRSIVVEVSPEMVSRAGLSGQAEKPERDLAEAIARRIATEITQGEIGSASDPADSIAQIGTLPDEIRETSPTRQQAGVRAWLL